MAETAHRCSTHVYHPHQFRPSGCSKPAKVERDGRWYCGIHDPERVAKKDAERRAKWEAESRANRKKWALETAAPGMLEALKAVELLMIPGMNWTDETGQLVKSMVREAIANATRE